MDQSSKWTVGTSCSLQAETTWADFHFQRPIIKFDRHTFLKHLTDFWWVSLCSVLNRNAGWCFFTVNKVFGGFLSAKTTIRWLLCTLFAIYQSNKSLRDYLAGKDKYKHESALLWANCLDGVKIKILHLDVVKRRGHMSAVPEKLEHTTFWAF